METPSPPWTTHTQLGTDTGLSFVLALTQSRAELAPYLLQLAFLVGLLVFDDLREVLGTVQGNFFS